METEAIGNLKSFLLTRPTEPQLRAWIAKLSPKDRFDCSLYLHRQGPTSFIQVLDLEHAFKHPEKLSDEELFKQLAQAFDDSTTIANGKIGIVNPRENPEPASRHASLYNEAVRRGFQREDIGFGMSPHLRASEKLGGMGDPDWKRFEKLVARIHLALCREAEVKWSEKLIDKSGTERQVDVTIRTRTGPHEVLGIIQCKFEKRPVSITEVEAFALSKADLNAGIAIMVSRTGYQSGAEAKGELHDIRLWTLEEAEKAMWREEVRNFSLRYPMFDKITFSPSIPLDSLSENHTSVDLQDIVITNGGQRTTLWNVVGQTIQNVSEACLRLPCWVDVTFPNNQVIIGKKVFPLDKVELHFSHYTRIDQQKEMKIPIGTSYTFKKSTGQDGISIAERDLPPLSN